jgi:hypothetical protein
MTPGLRKLILTSHIIFSVGWLGAVSAFLVLTFTGLTSHDAQAAHIVYPAMALIARFAIVPLALASLLSGLVQALGTPWGLFRYRWVVVKLLLTVFATIVLLKKMPLIGYAARRAAETGLLTGDLRAAGTELAVHAAGGLLVLLVVTTVSVYKPWGLTRYGQRKLQERYEMPQQLGNETQRPSRFAAFLVALGALLAVLVMLHLTGHSLHHGH